MALQLFFAINCIRNVFKVLISAFLFCFPFASSSYPPGEGGGGGGGAPKGRLCEPFLVLNRVPVLKETVVICRMTYKRYFAT